MILRHIRIVTAAVLVHAIAENVENAGDDRGLEIVIVTEDIEVDPEDVVDRGIGNGQEVEVKDAREIALEITRRRLLLPEVALAGIAGADGVPGSENALTERKRERKSRWSVTKSFVPGMPTILPSNLTDDQRTAYLREYYTYFFSFLW
ncbi:unnamed protein product [Cylicostephanus goldi]|uniref:Uncharacterized protein n=1 Tax=Cylicostephanus goldi TaxID=71465 RepID=A0A3P6TDW2_CYLGO|nr:unnamed protein product [Cylicostephanus goldi]